MINLKLFFLKEGWLDTLNCIKMIETPLKIRIILVYFFWRNNQAVFKSLQTQSYAMTRRYHLYMLVICV